MVNDLGPLSVKKTRIVELWRSMKIRTTETVKVTALTPKQERARVVFAKNGESEGLVWMPWIFRDETMIDLNGPRSFAHRIPGLTMDEGKFQECRVYPVKVTVRATVGQDYKSDLSRPDGTMTAEKYVAMLRSSMVPEDLNRSHPEGWVFQNDGAPPHRAKTTKEGLAQMVHVIH